MTLGKKTKNQLISELAEMRRRVSELEQSEARGRRTGEERQGNEARYRAILDSAQDAIISIDSGGSITDWNKAAEHLFGYVPDEIVGSPLITILPHQFRGDFAQRFEQSQKLLTNAQWRLNFFGLKKDGTEFPVEMAFSSWKSDDEVFFTAIIRDITERIQAEKVLQDNRKRLQLALQSGRLGVWDENYVTGKAVYDQVWAEMLGYTIDEIEPNIGAWQKLVHPDDIGQVEKSFADHIKGDITFPNIDFRMKAKSGEWRWINSRGQVVEWDEDGNPLRATGTHQDITERVRTEKELQESIQDLQIINTLNKLANSGASLTDILQVLSEETLTQFNSLGVTAYLLDADHKHLVMQNNLLPSKITAQIEKLIGGSIPPIRLPMVNGSPYKAITDKGKFYLTDDKEAIIKIIQQFINAAPYTEKRKKNIRKFIPLILKFLDIQSIMCIPMKTNGEIVGILDISRKTPFTSHDAERLGLLAEKVSSIVQKKMVEDTLREVEERYRSVVEQSPLGIFIVDDNYRFIYANDGLSRIFGFLKRRSLARISKDFSMMRASSLLQTVILGGKVVRRYLPGMSFMLSGKTARRGASKSTLIYSRICPEE